MAEIEERFSNNDHESYGNNDRLKRRRLDSDGNDYAVHENAAGLGSADCPFEIDAGDDFDGHVDGSNISDDHDSGVGSAEQQSRTAAAAAVAGGSWSHVVTNVADLAPGDQVCFSFSCALCVVCCALCIDLHDSRSFCVVVNCFFFLFISCL